MSRDVVIHLILLSTINITQAEDQGWCQGNRKVMDGCKGNE